MCQKLIPPYIANWHMSYMNKTRFIYLIRVFSEDNHKRLWVYAESLNLRFTKKVLRYQLSVPVVSLVLVLVLFI